MEPLGPQVETTELAQYADGFVAWLDRLGYSPKTCQAQVALLRHLARWLTEQPVPLSGLSSEVAGEYVAVRRRERSFLRSARALGPLLGYLRELGAVPPASAVVPHEPVDVLLARFGDGCPASAAWPRPRCPATCIRHGPSPMRVPGSPAS